MPVRDLVIQCADAVPNPIRIAWTCPQSAYYNIYSTTVKNNDGTPPGPNWSLEGTVWGEMGQLLVWSPPDAAIADYLNYVVRTDCRPFILPEK
jgi:hypothetical protein